MSTMDPIETLSNEHGLIRQYLDNLSIAAEKIEHGERPSAAFFEKALDFARSFADGYHHFKEEHVLFVQLAQKRQGELDAQLETLRQQHVRSRELIAGMDRSLAGYVSQDSIKTADLLESMVTYAALLRLHIHTEDHVFYPMARRVLDQGEIDTLAEEFEKQRQRHGEDTFERCHKLVIDMGSILTHLA